MIWRSDVCPNPDDTRASGLLDGILKSLKTQTATWFVGLVIAMLGLFSARITESVKFALNRADLRTTQYEELATEVSQYICIAELNTEFIEYEWTNRRSLTGLISEYNESISTLRKKEYVYLAWIQKFWGEGEVARFEEFMNAVREFDSAIHSLNDQFEAVNITEKQEKVDPERAKEALELLIPAVESVRKNGRRLLLSLS